MAYRKIPGGGDGYTRIPMAYAATVTLDLSRAENPYFEIAELTGNITLRAINGRDKQHARVGIKQAASGGPHTLTWHSDDFEGTDDLALPSASTDAANIDNFTFYRDSRATKPYVVIASNKGAS